MCQTWALLSDWTIDDFNKVVLALVALVALFVGPVVQYKIAMRQVRTQADIANAQVETQRQIARRQIADNIASKRQEWINGLREDLAACLTLQSEIAEIKALYQRSSGTEQTSLKEKLGALTYKAQEVLTRIKLRLNQAEADHQKLLETLAGVSKAGDFPKPMASPEELEQRNLAAVQAFHDAVAQAQIVLKKEWERVKRSD